MQARMLHGCERVSFTEPSALQYSMFSWMQMTSVPHTPRNVNLGPCQTLTATWRAKTGRRSQSGDCFSFLNSMVRRSPAKIQHRSHRHCKNPSLRSWVFDNVFKLPVNLRCPSWTRWIPMVSLCVSIWLCIGLILTLFLQQRKGSQ